MFKYILKFSNGDILDSEEEYSDSNPDEATFDSYEEAEEAGLYAVSCTKEGADIRYMNDPYDDDYSEYDDPELEVVEVDD